MASIDSRLPYLNESQTEVTFKIKNLISNFDILNIGDQVQTIKSLRILYTKLWRSKTSKGNDKSKNSILSSTLSIIAQMSILSYKS